MTKLDSQALKLLPYFHNSVQSRLVKLFSHDSKFAWGRNEITGVYYQHGKPEFYLKEDQDEYELGGTGNWGCLMEYDELKIHQLERITERF